MKYVLLLSMAIDDDDGESAAGDGRRELQRYAELQRSAELKQQLQSEGVWLGGQALQPGAVTTQVQVRDAETLLVDGPRLENAEQIVGYYLLDCRDLDEAIAVASRIPGARQGTVEVRPVFDYEALLD